MDKVVLNFNVGILGHVDSGKTTLVKTLSSVASTAAFDKNPQSQERGITIDLGFSSFCVDFPEHLKSNEHKYNTLQFTLVDCPGHASLIRTIIGGAQIIDMMILVIDITKGIQTQTAECLIIGEITCNHLIVVLNKIDMISIEKREAVINKTMKKIAKTLDATKFSNVPMVPIAANPGGNEEGNKQEPIGIDILIKTITQNSYLPHRSKEGQFVFAVDHCFAIKGQGTVMTGTVIQGLIQINDQIEVPSEKIIRKVKSIQMFKKPVEKAIQGDRVGICVTQFDPKLLERGAVCSPDYMTFVDAVIVSINKIPYFKGNCSTNSKFHISIMHDTILAKCTFFGLLRKNDIAGLSIHESKEGDFNYNEEFLYLNEVETTQNVGDSKQIIAYYALLQFEKPVIINKGSLLIGSKLDIDIHSNVCRLAFYGSVLERFMNKQQLDANLVNLKVYKEKSKEGTIDRITNDYEVIVKDLFKKETNIQSFLNLKVSLSTGEKGFIEGTFGQSGKIKIRIPNGLSPETIKNLGKRKGKKEISEKHEHTEPVKVFLNFKRYIYDPKKKMIQV